jgi:hypothetical protein
MVMVMMVETSRESQAHQHNQRDDNLCHFFS